MEVSVLQNQSVFDLAIGLAGSVEAVFNFMLLNGLSVTDEIRAGTTLTTPAIVRKQIADYYHLNNIHPATALSLEDKALLHGGVEFWFVGFDFFVS